MYVCILSYASILLLTCCTANESVYIHVHVNYLPAAIKDENTMTMAMTMKNASGTTLTTFLASTIVWLGRITIRREALVPLCLGWVLVHYSFSPGYIYTYIDGGH